MFKSILILVLFTTLSAQAADLNFAAKVESLAADYSARQQLKDFRKIHFNLRSDVRDCDPNQPPQTSCMDSVCKLLGTFGCDSQSEIQQVSQACRGNRGGECVEKACGYLGTFGCDSMNEASQVATSCRGIWQTACIDDVCKRLGTFGCDSMSEITTVIQSCR